MRRNIYYMGFLIQEMSYESACAILKPRSMAKTSAKQLLRLRGMTKDAYSLRRRYDVSDDQDIFWSGYKVEQMRGLVYYNQVIPLKARLKEAEYRSPLKQPYWRRTHLRRWASPPSPTLTCGGTTSMCRSRRIVEITFTVRN